MPQHLSEIQPLLPNKQRKIWRIDVIANSCLCGIIALVPLPFGSTDLFVIAVWVLALSATAGLASFRAVNSRDALFLIGLAIVAVCWGLVVFEQINSAPIEKLTNPIWSKTASLTGQPLTVGVSIVRHQTFFSIGSELACALSIFCGFLLGRDRNSAHAILRTFAWSNLVYALYGLIAFIFWPNYLLWQEKSTYLNSLVATFINRNVAAVYFGAGVIAWMLILTSSLDASLAGRPRRLRHIVEAVLTHPSRLTMSACTASFIVLSAMLLTGSRAGSILSMLALVGSGATYYRRELGTSRLLLLFPFGAIGSILLTLQALGGSVIQRFESAGLFDSGRWSVYLSTLKIVADYPWLGTGIGTFRWSFPAYRSDDISITGIWADTHSTGLEIASEMGIPFCVLIAAAWFSILFVLGRGTLTRKRDSVLPMTAFWIGLLGFTHSQIDFSMQIPGFSIPVCALIGMGIAQSSSTRLI